MDSGRRWRADFMRWRAIPDGRSRCCCCRSLSCFTALTASPGARGRSFRARGIAGQPAYENNRGARACDRGKDNTTHDHLRRVQVYAMEVGRELKLDDNDLEALRAAAVLHDIGKLAVPEYIISKPESYRPKNSRR